jgi:hypothetical protein
VQISARRHHELLKGVQRFRGSVYVDDGAVLPHELSSGGRHELPIDQDSWHVVTVDDHGEVSACLRFLEETTVTDFDGLWISHAAITQSDDWGPRIRCAVEGEIRKARAHGMCFGEVGGWAIARTRRGTVEALRTILATYGLLQILGNCIGLATATSRHGSAPILRRIGLHGLPVEGGEVPAYFDPKYGCEMELLRYDSRHPNPKYADWIEELSEFLLYSEVVCADTFVDRKRATPTWALNMPLAACL